ncbi:hypothetical protein [[Erwinia] mediterraneensis]|uniref:hypothetical protein n=1 Tax=[Erwinia] mediterraneensis TaxID=2161819 RepID=UPI0010306F84|nr:hypothetical protein [[Erwinia] mediterraneensis]
MKFSLLLLLGITLSSSALAAEDTPENIYASQLCHIAGGASADMSDDQYIAQMKDALSRSQPSYAMNKQSFDEDLAREVVSAWQELDDGERNRLRSNEQQCQQAVMTQFRQED